MREKILSNDFQGASEALEENTRNKRADLIRISLEHPSFNIKRKAAKALVDLADKDSVSALVEALEKNQVTYMGSSETKAMQHHINNDLIAALRRVTGLGFPVASHLSKYAPKLLTYTSSDIKETILLTKEWLASTKQ